MALRSKYRSYAGSPLGQCRAYMTLTIDTVCKEIGVPQGVAGSCPHLAGLTGL